MKGENTSVKWNCIISKLNYYIMRPSLYVQHEKPSIFPGIGHWLPLHLLLIPSRRFSFSWPPPIHLQKQHYCGFRLQFGPSITTRSRQVSPPSNHFMNTRDNRLPNPNVCITHFQRIFARVDDASAPPPH